ncbi:carboxy-terminal processing protease [Staphylococcus epidermidis]|nr:carboxy-terminal processing protease [Staphylococcus epidermidis]
MLQKVFTGAMKDYHKAKVYGSKNICKGIVQTTREFSDGSLIKIYRDEMANA